MSPYILTTRFQPNTIDFKIIAVQGLWANPEWTWKKHGVSWLEDLLPLDIKNACTMTFGPAVASTPQRNNAVSRQWADRQSVLISLGLLMTGLLPPGAWYYPWRYFAFISSAVIMLKQTISYLQIYHMYLMTTPATEIHDQAVLLLEEIERVHREDQDLAPMIFIGHSFGGLVVKEAMIISARESRYAHIVKLAQGFIFMGTPHRGARLATAAKYWWFQATSDIRAVLEIDSKVLAGLDESFLRLPAIRANRNIYCFFEQKPTIYGPPFLHFSMMVVDEKSATLPGYPSQGLAAKHSDLVKFEGSNDPNYQRLIVAIRQIQDYMILRKA